MRVSEFDDIGTDMRDLGFGLIQGPDGLLYVNFGKETVVMRRIADGTWTGTPPRLRASGRSGRPRRFSPKPMARYGCRSAFKSCASTAIAPGRWRRRRRRS